MSLMRRLVPLLVLMVAVGALVAIVPWATYTSRKVPNLHLSSPARVATPRSVTPPSVPATTPAARPPISCPPGKSALQSSDGTWFCLHVTRYAPPSLIGSGECSPSDPTCDPANYPGSTPAETPLPPATVPRSETTPSGCAALNGTDITIPSGYDCYR